MVPQAQRMAAITIFMGTWWICESIPIPATGLIPLALMPWLGILRINEAGAPYASDSIFLFMGGFILALAMQRWHLHRRMALHIINHVGFSPARIVLGFMVASAGISAFVSKEPLIKS